MITRVCRHCGMKVEGLSKDWDRVAEIPWCSLGYAKLWAILPKNFSREQYAEAHAVLHILDLRAQDTLLISLALAPRCMCNICGGGRG